VPTRLRAGLVLLLLASLGAGCGNEPADTHIPPRIHRIRHVIVVMQENRSFDSYFGTFPGADGIPNEMFSGAGCNPDPGSGACLRPYHDTGQINVGGPHKARNALADIDGGRMDGFVGQVRTALTDPCRRNPTLPSCVIDSSHPDVMGYHTAGELPNYWAYAHRFVLQDHMFPSNLGWSLPSHLAMVSGWAATCSSPTDPLSCRSTTGGNRLRLAAGHIRYPWTDLTYLLATHNVSWRYFVEPGVQPDCVDGDMQCPPHPQGAHTPSIWNPLPHFLDVHTDEQTWNVQASSHFFADARAGTLPSVSWIVPSVRNSEHPPSPIWRGQAWVTRIVDAVMRSPDWRSSAIFISWDDWGGFYDNVQPPRVDPLGYGIRVPGIMISPYARRGYIDHQTLSFDAYLKFIEDDFLGGQRLDPATDGRPDSRPSVRENEPRLGNLLSEFDFSQRPHRPLLLPPIPSRPHRCAADRVRSCHSTRPARTRPG
jgi:phospholipase C